MKKNGLLLLVIFCLGFFIMPKQNFSAQNMQSSFCCEQSSPEKTDNNCCDNEGDHHSTKGCQDTDCTTCHTCYNFLSLVFVNFEKKTGPSANLTYKNQNFFYKSPAFSSTARDIWQPPKIG